MSDQHILVVDDDEQIVDETVRALRLEGFDAIGSSHPRGAAKLAREKGCELVLLDIRMPEYGGYRVLLDLTVMSPTTKVIMMSADTDIEDILECIRHGAIDFISKPFDLDELIPRIKVNILRPKFQLDQVALREDLIDSLWVNAQAELGLVRGRRLEQLLYHVFASIPFFRDIRTNLRGDLDEIDVEAVNDGTSQFWRESGSLIAAECKNWSGSARAAGIQEYDHFAQSMRRSVRHKTGFFISMTGFSTEFQIGRMRALDEGRVMVPVDKSDIEVLVRSRNRATVLEEWIRKFSR